MNYGNERAEAAAAQAGLPPGRLITWSKSWYRDTCPDNVPVFNATLADADGVGLWWGDLDLTRDEAKLIALAAELETTIHVLYESRAARVDRARWIFDTTAPVLSVRPDGTVVVPEREAAYVGRDAAGRLVRLHPPEWVGPEPVLPEPQQERNDAQG